jgi:cob(I)alamin adenosyltransferase
MHNDLLCCMPMKIYTRGGDQGETGLVGGQRVSKSSPRVAAYGEVDELNAVLGVAAVEVREEPCAKLLAEVQRILFDLGAELATPPGSESSRGTPALGPEPSAALESAIDVLTAKLPALRHFILPGGSRAGAALHHARTVCRRAERAVVALSAAEPVNPQSIVYLNRLSDYLFVLARAMNHAAGAHELEWHGRGERG